ncbi:hypothetical protein [Streptomyces sp. NPDC058108]
MACALSHDPLGRAVPAPDDDPGVLNIQVGEQVVLPFDIACLSRGKAR